MRFFVNEKKLVVVSELKGIQCNKCGCIFEPNYEDRVQRFDNILFGYGSEYVNQKPWGFELCEECLLEFIKEFKIVPENFMSSASLISVCDSDSELHQKAFDHWKETDEWDYDDENPYGDHYHGNGINDENEVENEEQQQQEETNENETECIIYDLFPKPEITD